VAAGPQCSKPLISNRALWYKDTQVTQTPFLRRSLSNKIIDILLCHSDVNISQKVYPKNSAGLTFLILPMPSTWPVRRKWHWPKYKSSCDVRNCLFNTYYAPRYFLKNVFQLSVILFCLITSDHVVHPSVDITFLIFSVLETKRGDFGFRTWYWPISP